MSTPTHASTFPPLVPMDTHGVDQQETWHWTPAVLRPTSLYGTLPRGWMLKWSKASYCVVWTPYRPPPPRGGGVRGWKQSCVPQIGLQFPASIINLKKRIKEKSKNGLKFPASLMIFAFPLRKLRSAGAGPGPKRPPPPWGSLSNSPVQRRHSSEPPGAVRCL